jgi:uncharacterized oxidoreductase
MRGNQEMAGVLIQSEELRRLVRGVFAATGSDPDEAEIVADHLVEANLRGHDSHGVGLIPMYMRDRLAGFLRANGHARLVREDGVIGIFDGGMGYGHVIAREATEWGLTKARASGVAIVALRDTYHLARVGSYGEQAAAVGLASIIFVNVVSGPQTVAPFGGTDGRFQTNPICIAVPAGFHLPPVVLDFATSRIALGKVRVAYNEKRELKPGMLQDSHAVPTSDPAVMFEEPLGSLLAFGEHKGSGLALMCELLAGALIGGSTNHVVKPPRSGVTNNMLAVFIDPARFGEFPLFGREVEAVLSHVRASPPASPGLPVLVAGEPERLARRQRLASGIPIDQKTWDEIRAIAEKVGAIA